MNRIRLLLLSLVCMTCFATRAEPAEIDTVTATRSLLKRFFHRDASADINDFVNAKIDLAINELNRRQISCPLNQDEARSVYSVVKKSISERMFFIGHTIAEDIQAAIPEAKLYVIPLEDSIYNQYHWWTFDGIAVSIKGTLDIIKINGTLWGYDFIGLDKLGHFFKEGFVFFDKAYLQDDGSVAEAISWGQAVEKSYFGEKTTGIYSYADLVANFNGMRFWNQLLMFSPDLIDKDDWHNSPYFICKAVESDVLAVSSSRPAKRTVRKLQLVSWHKGKDFYLHQYADGAWDETNNCNQYKNVAVAKKIYAAMFEVLGEDKLLQQTLSAEQFTDLRPLLAEICPRIPSKCETASRKYATYASELLHPNCRVY